MSLKTKLKRALNKAHEFLIVFTVVFVLVFCSCVTASAETIYHTSFINLTNARATDYADNEFSSSYSLNPTKMISPFGGVAQGFKLPLPKQVRYRGINANMYYDSFEFKKDHEYVLSFYIFIDAKILNSDGNNGSVLNDLVTLGVGLCDSNRNIRLRFVANTEKVIDSSIGSRYLYQLNENWSFNNLSDTVNSSVFGFYRCETSFVPSETFNSTFLNFYFDCYSQTFQTSYFGLSDLTLSYTVDPLTDPKYGKVDGSSIDKHNQMSEKLESATSDGINTAVSTIRSIVENLTDSSIATGLFAWTKIISEGLGFVGFYEELLNFSLSLGLFGFLLGLSLFVIGRTRYGSSSRSRSYRSSHPSSGPGRSNSQ